MTTISLSELEDRLNALMRRAGAEPIEYGGLPMSGLGTLTRTLLAVTEKLVERIEALEKK